MTRILLIQLPIPQLNFGRRTGNVPMASACLKQAASGFRDGRIEILPESISSYLGDSALIRQAIEKKPDIIGFTLFNWNIERSLYLAKKIKEAYELKIIFGGPEVTPDNTLLNNNIADFLVFGEGESVFIELLENKNIWEEKRGEASAEKIFRSALSPYCKGLLEPEIDRIMYMETQRGCPFRCGFCYYNKSMNRVIYANEEPLVDGIRWAVEHKIDELCFLDPSLNTRPGLKSLLKKIAAVNPEKQTTLTGEIRAESIDREAADLFASAGFSMFEIGLQSINPKALQIMNRPTDLSRFLNGTFLLKKRDILPRIDLIVGLPGDTLEGFKRSADFVAENDLFNDIMVFPLSILPGTDFRRKSKALEIEFETSPPYTVLSTPQFSQEEMLFAFDYAEELFDVSLFPDPHLDISFRTGFLKELPITDSDHSVRINGAGYVSKLILSRERSLEEIETLSKKMTCPYQIIIKRKVSSVEYIRKMLKILSSENPYSPFEIIFMEPRAIPNTENLLSAIQIHRPHYLDNDLHFLYGSRGNRTVLFTVVSQQNRLFFYGEMKRQIFWWKSGKMPEREDMEALSDFNGILIDSPGSNDEIIKWQDRLAGQVDDILLISFTDTGLQKRWIELTAFDEYYTNF
ncbi:MAG: B12-binding domain-containing radical SAM protein [Desulfobacterales bacterium]